MIKCLGLLGLLLFTQSSFAMLYDEEPDSNRKILITSLTQPGDRYSRSSTPMQQMIPLKEMAVAKNALKPQRSCLSILEFLLQQYEYVLVNPFAITS